MYLSLANNTSTVQYKPSLKEAMNDCSITITPSNDCSNSETNDIFDIHCLYQQGVKLTKDKSTSNGKLKEVSYSSQTLKNYGTEFFCKKSKSLKNEEDSIKGKNIDEVYEEYLKRRQGKVRKEEVTLFNQRYFKKNVNKKK